MEGTKLGNFRRASCVQHSSSGIEDVWTINNEVNLSCLDLSRVRVLLLLERGCGSLK